jgi:hypothetical protein
MATTFTKIASVTVGAGGAANITFSSIPNTYTDLQVNLSARSDAASQDFANTYIAFNGSSANYSLTWLGVAGTSAVSYTQSAFGGANHLFYIPASTATSNTFGNSSIYLPNYAGSNYKSLNADGANENNASAIYEGLSNGLWSVTSAITSLAITTQGSFVQYSTATLYGIKNS